MSENMYKDSVAGTKDCAIAGTTGRCPPDTIEKNGAVIAGKE